MGNLTNIFNIIDFENKEKELKFKTYKVDAEFVHPADHPIVDYIYECDRFRTVPFIAGGACLAWYQNQPVTTDIDVYFRNGIDFVAFKTAWETGNMFKKGYYTVKSTSDNALTFGAYDNKTERTWTVQLIKKKFYSTLEELLDDFDITVCKIGYDGTNVVTRSSFVHDVATKTLRFDNINPMSHKRLVKYMAYGYEPAWGEIERLVANENIDWDTKGTDHYA